MILQMLTKINAFAVCKKTILAQKSPSTEMNRVTQKLKSLDENEDVLTIQNEDQFRKIYQNF